MPTNRIQFPTQQVRTYSIPLLPLAFLFVILKACGIIGWSWWWVLSPLWFVPAIFIAAWAIVVAVALVVIIVAFIFCIIIACLKG